MAKLGVIVTSLLGLIYSVVGQVEFPGQCNNNIPVVQNFNASAFLGRWNLIETYPSEFQNGACIEATYTLGENGTVDVFNTQVINQELDTILGSATAAADGSGRLVVTFPNTPGPSDYWILATDYDTFAFVYSCVDITNTTQAVFSWKMSRTKALTPAANVAISTIVASTANVLNATYYQVVDQSTQGCFYFPTPDPLQQVRFRGACDANVNVVQDFSVADFLGTWHLIETYPSVFQNGDCSVAEYSLGDGVVDVFNSQVINQTLDTMLGYAVVASNDGSARLLVTFPVAGTNVTVQTPYWVLDTDYTSYALIYTCVDDVDEYGDTYRQVWSWKVSRSKQLSNDAAIAINNVTRNIQVLDDRYYQTVNQTTDGCFYFPDPRPGVPVTFNGQCTDINLQPNFSPEAFQGLWHEIEAYPKEFGQGACVNHHFRNSSVADFDVTSTFVNGTTLNLSNATMTLAGNARLIITINANGNTVQIPFWIVSTDYTSYALAYSCVNVGDYSRSVVSWKLSRGRTLTPAAQIAIYDAMFDIDVIDDRYFETIDQSNDGCFHYPEFDVLPPVIELIGQCPNISGIPNFNAAGYLGTWFEIEKYPQLFQEGQCGRATYSLAGSVVDVYNTQVVNRSLLYQRGTAVPVGTSGELIVTFNVSGVTNVANYYVLATDYTSFALVYSCRNLDNGNREVFSWKLSRNASLSVEANAAMDVVIANTEGLDPTYYKITDQSSEACFYIPELNPEQPVRFRGTCNNISGQANFTLERYLGWWHETRRYPTGDNSTGQCISRRYQQSGNVTEFVDTDVVNQTAQVSRGTVLASNNGLLRKTYENGQVRDVWVLATDYDTYAIQVSCEPFDDEYVTVWSGIQRKTTTYSAAAATAIEQVINSHPFLSYHLYMSVDQGDDACLHYPEPVGDRVILRGQCNTNIPVQQNFELAQYTGNWYQIERYPYPEVSADSTCIGTRYTAGSGNTVAILNWETNADGVLNTQAGEATVNEAQALFEVSIDDARAALRVLATDYETFSLMYTCENINPFERAVVAFKLSRGRSLSAAANVAINNTMSSLPELHQQYFLSVTQNEDCADSSYFIKSSIILVLLSYTIHLLM